MEKLKLILQLIEGNITNHNNFNTDVRIGIQEKDKQTSAYPNIDIDDFKKKFIDCNFTDEQIHWINQIIMVVNNGQYYDMMKEFKPKAYEREVKECVKSFWNIRGLKF